MSLAYSQRCSRRAACRSMDDRSPASERVDDMNRPESVLSDVRHNYRPRIAHCRCRPLDRRRFHGHGGDTACRSAVGRAEETHNALRTGRRPVCRAGENFRYAGRGHRILYDASPWSLGSPFGSRLLVDACDGSGLGRFHVCLVCR